MNFKIVYFLELVSHTAKAVMPNMRYRRSDRHAVFWFQSITTRLPENVFRQPIHEPLILFAFLPRVFQCYGAVEYRIVAAVVVTVGNEIA